MTRKPILLLGGAGTVGRWAGRFLRDSHPDVPIVIGGRDRARAQEAADGLGEARGAAVDPLAEDLGLGPFPCSAVAVLFTDERVAGLRFAQARGAGYLSIAPGIAELGPEVAQFIGQPHASAVVLGTEWLVGATTVPTLAFAEAFARLESIHIGAVLDEQDEFGPAARADLERQTATMPAALARRGGRWVWRSGEDAKTTLRAVDGAPLEASAFSPNDVLGLAVATGAPDIAFDLALGESSSRRRGQALSTEIVVTLAGTDHDGKALRTRHAVVHPQGQMPLTGLGVAMVLERLAGLYGEPVSPGLYFPHQLLDRNRYLGRLGEIGGAVLTLEE